jgi:hypothetical protein
MMSDSIIRLRDDYNNDKRTTTDRKVDIDTRPAIAEEEGRWSEDET